MKSTLILINVQDVCIQSSDERYMLYHQEGLGPVASVDVNVVF